MAGMYKLIETYHTFISICFWITDGEAKVPCSLALTDCLFLAPLAQPPPLLTYLNNLYVVNPENISNVSRYCDTKLRIEQRVPSQRPLFLLGTEIFCISVFSFAAPSGGKTPVSQRSSGFGISPAQWWSLWPTCWANLCGYSHQCRLTQECQKGLVGRAGPEVQVDPSETHRKKHFKYQVVFCVETDKTGILCGNMNIMVISSSIKPKNYMIFFFFTVISTFTVRPYLFVVVFFLTGGLMCQVKILKYALKVYLLTQCKRNSLHLTFN